MEQTDTVRAVERAAARYARARAQLDAALLAATAANVTYEQLAELTSVDRRTISRKIAKLSELYWYEAREVRPGQVDYVLVSRQGITAAQFKGKGGK